MKRLLIVLVCMMYVCDVMTQNVTVPLDSILIVTPDWRAPKGSYIISKVSVEDEGFTIYRSFEKTLKLAVCETSNKGGNVFVLTKHKKPDSESSVHRVWGYAVKSNTPFDKSLTYPYLKNRLKALKDVKKIIASREMFLLGHRIGLAMENELPKCTFKGFEINIDSLWADTCSLLNNHQAAILDWHLKQQRGTFSFKGKKALFLGGSSGMNPISKDKFFISHYARFLSQSSSLDTIIPSPYDGQSINILSSEFANKVGYDVVINDWMKIDMGVEKRVKKALRTLEKRNKRK